MIYLIGQDYIRKNSPITFNVQDKELSSHILSAQELYTRKILGSDFYEFITLEFSAQTLSGHNVTLMNDYIKPQVMWRTLSFALPWIATNLRGKGVVTGTDENAFAASASVVRNLRTESDNRAEFHENLLWKYLCKNRDLFPEFTNQQNPLTPPLKDDSNLYDGGLIFY